MKKGQVGATVTVVVGLIIAIVILVNLAFPQVRTLYQAQTATQVLTVHVLGTNTTTTLSNTDLVASGLTVAGLTLTSNYTVDYDAATVKVLDTTANGTYTAAYSYYATGYIDSSGTRAMAAVIILALIVGLAVGALKMFGAM